MTLFLNLSNIGTDHAEWFGLDLTGPQIAIKFLLVAAIGLVGMFMLRSRGGDRSLAVRRLATLLFMVFAFVAVIWPRLVSHVASFLGVGRGTDLVLYLLAIAFFANLVTAYQRNAAVEDKITELARTVALNNVEHPDTSPQ